MKIADRIGLELALGRSFAFDLRQARDPMALEAAMQRRARQVRDGRLQSVKAIIERQQRMPSKGDDHGLLLDGQDGRSGLLRSCWEIGSRGAPPPLGDGLRVDP
jgi:hypothetical protein